jgi:DNA-binding beta-propeller fold protein YncE
MRLKNLFKNRPSGRLVPLLLLGAPFPVASQPLESSAPERDYYAYVAAESQDRVDLVRFGPDGGALVDSIPVGRFPTEIDGPHGLAMGPNGDRWYVTLAHGNPFGIVVAYSSSDNRPTGNAELGLFPATIQVTPAGLLFAVNFNLHGDPLPSSVSVVDIESMTEIARVPTCARPHGSRLTLDGARHYSVCVFDDQLVELDAHRLEVARRMHLQPGNEKGLDANGVDSGPAVNGSSGARCSPTWAHPSTDGARVYVACNGNAEVLEIDVESWTVRRRFETGAGPYNLDMTPDGRHLLVTYKGGQATGVWRLSDGTEVARVENTRRLPHGLAVTPDSRYAFVSVEGVGGEPGAVDVIDISGGRLVASIDVGKQAGGIVFWKAEAR